MSCAVGIDDVAWVEATVEDSEVALREAVGWIRKEDVLQALTLFGPIVGHIRQRSPGANAKLDGRLGRQCALDQSAGFAQAAGLCRLGGHVDEMPRAIVVGYCHGARDGYESCVLGYELWVLRPTQNWNMSCGHA